MSSKWPAKLFSYHPRVPVSTDAEEEAPPAPSAETLEKIVNEGSGGLICIIL